MSPEGFNKHKECHYEKNSTSNVTLKDFIDKNPSDFYEFNEDFNRRFWIEKYGFFTDSFLFPLTSQNLALVTELTN